VIRKSYQLVQNPKVFTVAEDGGIAVTQCYEPLQILTITAKFEP